MCHQPKEPLFTPKQWVLVMSLGAFYALVLFSVGPQWVAWAGPVAFGGALSVAGPPPTPTFSASPGETFSVAEFLCLLSLGALTLVARLRKEPGLGWFVWLRHTIQALQTEQFWRGFHHIMAHWKLDARALLPARRGSSIGQENWGRHPAEPARGHVNPASQRSRAVPGNL